jgi:hypothetical protein
MSDWGGYEKNVYYNPGECGMELLATLDAELSYEFEIVILLRDREGSLFAAYDAGCSCPTPFEDVRGLGDLTPVRSEDDLASIIKSREGEYFSWDSGDKQDFMRKAREALK